MKLFTKRSFSLSGDNQEFSYILIYLLRTNSCDNLNETLSNNTCKCGIYKNVIFSMKTRQQYKSHYAKFGNLYEKMEIVTSGNRLHTVKTASPENGSQVQ